MARERVICAMSGGVDSSVAAALLLEQGYEVIGLFMRNGVAPSEAAARGKQGCCSLEDSMDARRVAAKLEVPFYAVDFAADFSRIMDYFLDEYDRGRTPNPCVMCNRWLKFGKLLERADELGATMVATGHYARLVERDGRIAVRRGVDPEKDQAYVLFPLEQSQLRRTLLPLGELTKSEVRERARDLGLSVASKPDSQEICFVPDNDYGGFIRSRRPESLAEGDLVGTDGSILGRHPGHQHFTIGQRRGFGQGFGKPRYVVQIDAESNRVVIGDVDELEAHSLGIDRPVWQALGGLADGEECRGAVKVRYRHDPIPARAIGEAQGALRIKFDEPIRAVTPGQAAVLFDGDTVLVGGFIDRVDSGVDAGHE